MPNDRVRVTVTVEKDVYEVYQRMAKAGRQSLSMCMGEWLGDTADGALAIATQMEKARREPLKAIHNLQLYAAAMHDGTADLVEQIRAKREGARAAENAVRQSAPPPSPPSSNTGGTETMQSRGMGEKQ